MIAARTLRLYLVGLLIVVLAGCASTRQPPHSGFLGNYPNFVPSQRARGAYVWIRPGKKISGYYNFIIDPVTVYLDPDATGRGVDPAELHKLADYFRNQMITKILSSGAYKVVEQPGDGVLRIRAALTDVMPTKLGGVGGASMEAEFIDTGLKERIAAVIATRRGNPVSVGDDSSKWRQTQEVLSKWAQLLRDALDDRWVTDSFGNMRQ